MHTIICINRKSLRFVYKNYKGIVSTRNVIPEGVYYGTTEWHKQNQWLMTAFDLDKKADRTFAITDIISWVKDDKHKQGCVNNDTHILVGGI